MLKRLLTAAVVALAMLSFAVTGANAAVVAGNTGWYWSNPLPQGNTLSEVDTIAGRAYVAGQAGSIMRSDNGGASWTGIRSGLPADLSRINVLRAVNPDTIVFASDCGLRRSDDGGVTVRRLPWTSNDVSCAAPIVSLSFPTPVMGYLLLANGDILQTQDGGNSWRRQTPAPGSKVLGGAAKVSDIAFTSASSGVISVGNQLFYSTDSGSSWTPVATIDGGGLANFEFISPTKGFAVGAGTSLFATDDGGLTWAPVAGDGSTNGVAIGSLSCASANNCLAAAADGSKLLRTTDGGATWASLTASSRAIFGVGFTSATHAVAVGADGATVSTDDAGANWTSLTSEASGSFKTIHVDTRSSAVLFGVGTVLARTTDAGASYKAITTFASSTIADATFPTADRGYVLDSRNELTRSDDAGITWKVLDLAGAHPKVIYAPDSKTLLLVGDKGVRRSSDAGLSFKKVGDAKLRKARFTAVDQAGKAVAVSGWTSAAISSDGGKKWKMVKLPKKTPGIKFLDFADAKNGWLADLDDELWSTSNAGKKWVRVETTGLNKITSVAHTNAKRGYVADGSGSIFVTGDSGKTWSEQAPFLSANRTATRLAPLSTNSAILLVPGTNRILTTTSFGQIGAKSKLTIKSSKSKVKAGSKFQVTGRLSGAQGGEVVTVLARVRNASGGTDWEAITATVSLGGTFTTTWKVRKPTTFIARWAGDATHDGDGADAISVKVKK